jgi:hypothetical protein
MNGDHETQVVDDSAPEEVKPKRKRKAPRREATVKPEEGKSARFRRLANRRVPRAIKTIGYVGNLANKSQYEYTDREREMVCQALADAVQRVIERFQVVDANQVTFSV